MAFSSSDGIPLIATASTVVTVSTTTTNEDGIAEPTEYLTTLLRGDDIPDTGDASSPSSSSDIIPDSLPTGSASSTPFMPAYSTLLESSTSAADIATTSPLVSFGSGPQATAISSPTAAVATTSAANPRHGISKGALVAAVVAPIVAVLILLSCLTLFIRRRRQRQRRESAKTMEMRRVSPQDISAPVEPISSSGPMHTIPRKSVAVQSVYYTGISTPDHDEYQLPINGVDKPRPDARRQVTSPSASPPPSRPLTALLPTSPESGQALETHHLTEANLASHRDSQEPRPSSPFADPDDDNISDISSVGGHGKVHQRDADEVSVVSSLGDDTHEDVKKPLSGKDID